MHCTDRSFVRILILAIVTTSIAAEPARSQTEIETITIATTDVPPQWALLERHVLDGLAPAAMEFVKK